MERDNAVRIPSASPQNPNEKGGGSDMKDFFVLSKEKTSDELRQEIIDDVVKKKYMLEGETTREQVFDRVARAIASVEKTHSLQEEWRIKFYELMKSNKFMPGGRILYGAGNPKKPTLMNCFVNPIKEDSIEAIFEAAKEVARTFSLGGGEGIDISILRPSGAATENSANTSTGAVSFMHLFSLTTGLIGQNKRRGALMVTIDIAHPDTLAFIYAKSKPDSFTQEVIMMNSHRYEPEVLKAIEKVLTDTQIRFANISIKIRDEFMHAVEKDADWFFYYYDLVNPREHSVDIDSIIKAGAVLRHDMPISPYDLPNYGSYQLWEVRWNVKPDKNININGKYYELRKKRIYGSIRARELLDIIAQSIWESGDPGLLFWDNIVREHNAQYFQPLLSTNPCVTGDTRIATDKGLIKVEELYLSQEVLNVVYDKRAKNADIREKGTDVAVAAPIFKTRDNEKVYKVELKSGHVIKATADHKFFVLNKNGMQLKRLDELNIIEDKILVQSGEGKWGTKNNKTAALAYAAYYSLKVQQLYSLAVGYAQKFKRRTYAKYKYIYDKILKQLKGFQKKRLAELGITDEFTDESFERLLELFLADYDVEPIMTVDDLKQARVPDFIFKSNRDTVVQFLRLLFSSLSSMWVRPSGNNEMIFLGLYSLSKDFARDIQLLLNNFGIIAVLYEQEPRENCCGVNMMYRLILANHNVVQFYEKISFLHDEMVRFFKEWHKKNKDWVEEEGRRHTYAFHIKNIEELPGTYTVYDTEQYDNHSLIFNAIVTSNCSEKPLPAYGNCDLGSINLAEFVTENGFDYEGFKQAIYTGIRFLDNVIDYTHYPLPQHEKASLEARRLGLGVMGLADAFIKMKIKYDSEEALKFVDNIMKFMRDEAYKASVRLAEERGAFPAFDFDKWSQSEYVKRLPDEIREEIRQKGIRNSEIISIAPTGSISIVAGYVSSGLEPVFAFKYKRYSLGQLYDVYHPAVLKYIKEKYNITSEKEITQEMLDNLPDYFVDAHKVNWQKRVRLQGIMQKYVDSAISSTINVSNETPVSEIKAILYEAWKAGLKGITIFRDGSKSGVMTATKKVIVNGQEIEVYESEIYTCPACGKKSLLKTGRIKEIVGCDTYCYECNYSKCEK